MKTEKLKSRERLVRKLKEQELRNNLRYRHVNFNFGVLNNRVNNMISEIKKSSSKRQLKIGECSNYAGKLNFLLKQVTAMKVMVGDKAILDVDECLDAIREKVKIRNADDVDLLVDQFDKVAEQIHTHYQQFHVLSCLSRLYSKVIFTIEAISQYCEEVYAITL